MLNCVIDNMNGSSCLTLILEAGDLRITANVHRIDYSVVKCHEYIFNAAKGT